MADDADTRDEGGQAQVPAVQTAPRAELVAGDRREMLFMPRTIEEAQRYASGLIAANQVPDAFRYNAKDVTRLFREGKEVREGDPNAALILMGILKVMELEVPPQTGLAGLLPLNGRFSVWGDLAAALVQRSGKVKDHTDSRVGPGFDPDLPLGDWPNEYGWEVRYWRIGQEQPYIGRFTVRDAKRPGLWMNAGRKPWLQYPDRMLFNRARAFALRDGFADALMGLSIAEEVIDSLPVEAEPEHQGTSFSDAFSDEPEPAALEHQPEPEADLGRTVEREAQPDLLKRDF